MWPACSSQACSSQGVLQSLSGTWVHRPQALVAVAAGLPTGAPRFDPLFKGPGSWEPWTQRPWCLWSQSFVQRSPRRTIPNVAHCFVHCWGFIGLSLPHPQTLCSWNNSLVVKKEKARWPPKDCHLPKVSHVVGRAEVDRFLEQLKCTAWDSWLFHCAGIAGSGHCCPGNDLGKYELSVL